MRFDKFTTKFQQALSDAQSLAVGADNPYIERQTRFQMARANVTSAGQTRRSGARNRSV